MATWSYDGTNGPEQWNKLFALEITGRKQSPIDLSNEICEVLTNDSKKINPITIEYPENFENLELVNAGLCWKVDIPDELSNSTTLIGGPLKNKFKLAQFHCHWGMDCNCGSEHTVDGKSYAAELHLVHWNSDLYSSFSEAMKSPGGLAVIGVFLDAKNSNNENISGAENRVNINRLRFNQPNEEIDKLAQLMDKILYKGQSTIIESINLKELLPKNLSYFTYEGSLTTPPLYESVNWIVLKTPILVTEEQIGKFRQLHTHRENETPADGPKKLLYNFRPIQQLHDRAVRMVEI